MKSCMLENAPIDQFVDIYYSIMGLSQYTYHATEPEAVVGCMVPFIYVKPQEFVKPSLKMKATEVSTYPVVKKGNCFYHPVCWQKKTRNE